jgi:hypothetical protein
MEGSLGAASRREGAIKNLALRRKNWTTRAWRTSPRGNETLKCDGRRFTVFRRGQRWSALIHSDHPDVDVRFLQGSYPTIAEAQLAAFDLTYLR